MNTGMEKEKLKLLMRIEIAKSHLRKKLEKEPENKKLLDLLTQWR